MNKKPLRAIVFRKSPRPSKVQSGSQTKLFIVRHPDALKALKYWLMTRRYNTFIQGLDAHHNTLLELIYDYESGAYPSRRCKKRGAIAVWRAELIAPAKRLILQTMILDNEYVRWLHDKELERLDIHAENTATSTFS